VETALWNCRKKSGKIKSEYKHEYFHTNLDVDFNFAGPTIFGAVVFGWVCRLCDVLMSIFCLVDCWVSGLVFSGHVRHAVFKILLWFGFQFCFGKNTVFGSVFGFCRLMFSVCILYYFIISIFPGSHFSLCIWREELCRLLCVLTAVMVQLIVGESFLK